MRLRRATPWRSRANILVEYLKKSGKIPSILHKIRLCAQGNAATDLPIFSPAREPTPLTYVSPDIEEADMRRLIDRMRSRAYELARSGELADCDAVERRLMQEGHADAHLALLDPYVREHVTRLCQGRRQAGGGRTAAQELVSRYLDG
jgi:hypothetical protein